MALFLRDVTTECILASMQAPVLTPEQEELFRAEETVFSWMPSPAGDFPALPTETRILAKSTRAIWLMAKCLKYLKATVPLDDAVKDMIDRNVTNASDIMDTIVRVTGPKASADEQTYWEYWSARQRLLGGSYYATPAEKTAECEPDSKKRRAVK